MKETTMAGKPNVNNKNCKWQAKPKHKHDIIKDSLNLKGNTSRGDISGWSRPDNFFLKGNSPKHKDDNGGPVTSIKVRPWWGVRYDTEGFYLIQRHHVIPCKSISQIAQLANNLKFLGWDINDQEKNGICLPAYDEQIFWHDLPRHTGWTSEHASYNIDVTNELKEEWEEGWKDLCEEDEEQELLEYIQEYVNWVRNLIINWDPSVFLVRNGGDRSKSFKNAGYKRVPGKKKNRKYRGNV